MLDGRGGDPREEEFQIVGRRDEVPELLRNRFALFGEPDVAAQGVIRQRFEKAVRRSRATAHRAAATMEKANSHPGIAPELREWAAIERDVLLIGMGARFELWDKTRHEAHEATVLAAGLPDVMRDMVL